MGLAVVLLSFLQFLIISYMIKYIFNIPFNSKKYLDESQEKFNFFMDILSKNDATVIHSKISVDSDFFLVHVSETCLYSLTHFNNLISTREGYYLRFDDRSVSLSHMDYLTLHQAIMEKYLLQESDKIKKQ